MVIWSFALISSAASMFKSRSFHKPHIARPPSPAGYSRLVPTFFLHGSWGECSNSVYLPDHCRSTLLGAERFIATLRGPGWPKERTRKWVNEIWINPKFHFAQKLYLPLPSKWLFLIVNTRNSSRFKQHFYLFHSLSPFPSAWEMQRNECLKKETRWAEGHPRLDFQSWSNQGFV